MQNWDDFLTDVPTATQAPVVKTNWDTLLLEPKVAVDQTNVSIRPSRAQLLIQPYLDKGLDPLRALDAASESRTNRVNSVYNLGMDMANHNPISILKMADTESSLLGVSTNKLRREAKAKGLIFGEDEVDSAISEIKTKVPEMMGKDWLQREYDIKDNSVEVAFDAHDEVGELMTQDAYAYANRFLDDTDKKRADINMQIKAEKDKTIEEGRDENKIRSLSLQLNSLGKTYTDPDGNVIDMKTATPEQTDYIKAVDKYYDVYSQVQKSDVSKVKDAFFEQYAFVRSLDELHQNEVDPWLEQQNTVSENPLSTLPPSLKAIVDQRRDATAKLAALSKLYLANTSPVNVKKDLKYHLQSAAKGLSTGLLGKGITSALTDELGSTERDMLDAAQSIMGSKGLPVSEEIQNKFDRSLLEYTNEGASTMIGMLPLLAVAGGATNVLKLATGLEAVTTAWKAGSTFQKAAALMTDLAVEEIKLAGVGFAPGTGSGFVLAGRALPGAALKNPIANGILQFMLRPTIITSSMYGARVTESMVESMFSYKDFNDILTEKFGTGKELAGTAIANMMFAFGGAKSVSKETYQVAKDQIKILRKEGKEVDAVWLEQQVKVWDKMDKASNKAYKKGKFEGLTEDQIYEKMQAAEAEAASKGAIDTQITLEQQNLLERVVPPEKLSIVMRGSKMKDKEGVLQQWFHGTDKVFNRFSKIGVPSTTGSKANSRARELTFFAETPEIARGSFGSNVESRYLNFKNPIDVGNVRKLNAQKIADLRKRGYDGITGWETINGKKEKVAAAFGTQGIVKAEELLPFRSKHAESLRMWADQLRNKELRVQDIAQGGVPVSMAKFEKAGIEVMAKTLEIAGDVVEALAKGVAYIQETGWYKQLTPEDQAKFDPEIKARLQKLLTESKPEAVAKYDLERATKMSEEAKNKYLPDFVQQGDALAAQFNGEFISDVKKPENIVAKKNRKGLSDVTDVSDVVRGSIVVNDPKQIKDVIKELKKQGYDININRAPEKNTGRVGIRATKQVGELGTEIQIHTKSTLEAQRQAEALTLPYRDKVEKTDTQKQATKKFNDSLKNDSFTVSEDTPLKNTQYAILTAENPGGTALTPEENIKRNDALIKELKDAGFEPIPVEGHYGGNPEHSFIVPGMTNAEALEFGKRHGQESVLTPKGLIYQDGTYNPADVTKIDFASDKTDFYSTLKVGDKDVKFSIPIDFEVKKNLPEADMAQARTLYEEAYQDVLNQNLPGSPAPTAQDRKMKALELPTSIQKELKKSWTETKKNLLEGIKDVNRDMKAEFKQFVKDMPLTGLGVPLRKAMLNKVNAIDFTKPKSLDRAIAYFDKIIDNATFRYETIATMKALDGIEKRTSESFLSKKATNGLLKNKIGPSGLPLWDELKAIRKDMETGDWKQGQEEIQKIFDKYMNEDAPAFSIEDYNKIVRENFKGLLNETNGATRPAIEGALRDLKDIIKEGKTQAAAKAIADRAVQADFNQYAVKVLTANGFKPVKTDVLEKANVTEGRFDHILTWYKTSNWDSLMDIFSKFDSDKYMGAGQGSTPWNSKLSVEMRNVVKDANKNQYHAKLQIMNEVQDKFRESLGVSTDKELKKIEHDNSTVKHVITYKNILGVEKTVEMTRNQALKVWMEMQDPSLQKSNEAPSENHDSYMRNGELTDLGKKVEELLTPGLKKWGQWQLDEFYPSYWPRINEVYRRKFGVDMPLNEKYSPIFVAEKFIEGGVGDDIILSRQNALSTATNASLKARVSHGKKLALMDANKVLINYIDKMEFFINWTDALDFVNNTFVKDGNIREAIKQNFGRNALSAVEATIKDFGQAPRDSRYAAGWINTLRNNLTIASLALKPNVFFSQLTSQPAYIDKIGAINYVKNNPFNDWEGTKVAFNNIKNSDYWKMRYGEGGGWDWTVMEAMKKDVNSLSGNSDWQTLKNQSMFLTKYGDMVSVVTGGIPVYKHFYNKVLKETGNKALAHNIAMNEFTDITDKSQQASQVYDLSQVQRDPILKMATMYRTAPMQYHRNVIAAFRNGVLPTSGQRGTSFGNLKTIAIYHVLLPSLYQFAANGFQWDKKEQLRAAALGNFGDIFIAGDVIEGILNSVRGLPWDYQFSPLEQIVVNAKKSAVHASAFAKQLNNAVESVTYDELGKAAWDAARVLGDVTGTPVAAVQSKASAIKDVVEGKTEHPVGRIIGWSESVMSGNMKDLTDSETMMNIEKFKKGILPTQNIPGPVKPKSKEIPKNKRIPEF